MVRAEISSEMDLDEVYRRELIEMIQELHLPRLGEANRLIPDLFQKFLLPYLMNRVKLVSAVDWETLRYRKPRQLNSSPVDTDFADLLRIDAYENALLYETQVFESTPHSDDHAAFLLLSKLMERPLIDMAYMRLEPLILGPNNTWRMYYLEGDINNYFDMAFDPEYKDEPEWERLLKYWYWMPIENQWRIEIKQISEGDIDVVRFMYCCRMFAYCTHRMQKELCKAIPLFLCNGRLILKDEMLLMILKMSRHPTDFFYHMRLHVLRAALQTSNVQVLVRASIPSCHDSTCIRKLRMLCFKKAMKLACFDGHAALYLYRCTNNGSFLSSIKQKTFDYANFSGSLDEWVVFVEAGVPELYTGQYGLDNC